MIIEMILWILGLIVLIIGAIIMRRLNQTLNKMNKKLGEVKHE